MHFGLVLFDIVYNVTLLVVGGSYRIHLSHFFSDKELTETNTHTMNAKCVLYRLDRRSIYMYIWSVWLHRYSLVHWHIHEIVFANWFNITFNWIAYDATIFQCWIIALDTHWLARFASTDRFAIYSIIPMNVFVGSSARVSIHSVLVFHFKKCSCFTVFNFFFFVDYSSRWFELYVWTGKRSYVSQMILVSCFMGSFGPQDKTILHAIRNNHYSCFEFLSTFFLSLSVFYHHISPAILPPTLTHCRVHHTSLSFNFISVPRW